VAIDCSRWDQHCSAPVLELEHACYVRLYGGDVRLAALMRQQLDNRGTTMHGGRYSCYGRRMSGDANTASGNCLLMAAMVRALMRSLDMDEWDVLVDGDNAHLFVCEDYLQRVLAAMGPVFLSFGQELGDTSVHRTWQDVPMGQQKSVWADDRWVMVPSPSRVLSGTFVSNKHYHERKGGRRAARTIAQAMLVLYRGVPVLQSFALGALRATEGVKWLDSALDDYQTDTLRQLAGRGDWHVTGPADITPKARETMELVWGVTKERQIALESAMAAATESLRSLDMRPAQELWVSVGGAAFLVNVPINA